jgi:hypothetical protein
MNPEIIICSRESREQVCDQIEAEAVGRASVIDETATGIKPIGAGIDSELLV